MPKLSQKINAPFVRKRSSIQLLDRNKTIKLPIAPNPVHMLQEFLKVELSKEKEKPRNAARVQGARIQGRRPLTERG